MSTTTMDNTATGGVETRILREGYGEGAWHGPDLRAALADVTSEGAFRRLHQGATTSPRSPCTTRTARGVRAKLTDIDAEPFVLEGNDWFALSDPSTLPWPKIFDVVEIEHKRLTACLAALEPNRPGSSLTESECFDLALGITCHAVYHAGQIQLIKRLAMA
jgi:hypothetical protein